METAERLNTCMCINCMTEYEEEDLISITDNNGEGYGCPKCNTDEYIMDINE